MQAVALLILVSLVGIVASGQAQSLGHGIHDPKPAHGTPKDVPQFTVDLSLPPEERWGKIVAPFKGQIEVILQYVLGQFEPKVAKELVAVFGFVDRYLPKQYADEIRGVAKSTGFDLGELVIMNLFYELDAACTSIVAQSAAGAIFHGRNLDFSIPNLQNVTIQVDFVNGTNTPIYRATTYAGYVGVLTGLKPNSFSVSLDERWDNQTLLSNLYEFINGAHAIAFVYRDILGSGMDFETAVEYLADVRLMTVSYVIIGGVKENQGAVITRDREHAADIWRLDYPNRWFLVETNYDHWLPTPTDDDRRAPAYKHMFQYNPNTINNETMWDVMNQFSNLNSETTYSVSMSAKLDTYHVKTQNNP